MKKIFIVNGKPRSGKDTFARELNSIFKSKRLKCIKKISIIDQVKNIARECGWDDGKTDKDRKFLSDLKDLMDEYNFYPFLTVSKEVQMFIKDPYSEVLLIDMREPKDIELAKKIFKAETIFIDNPNVSSVTSNHADGCTLDSDYKYDYIITNDGTLDEFCEKIKLFYNDVILEGK